MARYLTLALFLFFVIGGDAGLATFVYDQSRSRMLHTLQHEGLHHSVSR